MGNLQSMHYICRDQFKFILVFLSPLYRNWIVIAWIPNQSLDPRAAYHMSNDINNERIVTKHTYANWLAQLMTFELPGNAPSDNSRSSLIWFRVLFIITFGTPFLLVSCSQIRFSPFIWQTYCLYYNSRWYLCRLRTFPCWFFRAMYTRQGVWRSNEPHAS